MLCSLIHRLIQLFIDYCQIFLISHSVDARSQLFLSHDRTNFDFTFNWGEGYLVLEYLHPLNQLRKYDAELVKHSYGVLVALVKVGAPKKLDLSIFKNRAAVRLCRVNVLYGRNIYLASKMNCLHHEISKLIHTIVAQVLHYLDFLLIRNKGYEVVVG